MSISFIQQILTKAVDITDEDRILLHACRRYIAVTDTDAGGFCSELFDLASQAVAHANDDYEQAFLTLSGGNLVSVE